MSWGDNLLYKATYIEKRGRLPYGTEVQFISDKYTETSFLFNKTILPSNFEKEIVAACKKQYGIDVSLDFGILSGKTFKVECLTYQQKYPNRQQVATTNTSQSTNDGCMASFKELMWKIIKACILALLLIIVILVLGFIYGEK